MFRRLMPTLGALAVAFAVTACEQGLSTDLDQPALASGSSIDNRMGIVLVGSSAFPDAGGKARFRDRGGERQLQIQIEDGPANGTLVFSVDGFVVGEATILLGRAKIRLNSDDGDDVPLVGPGSTVSVMFGMLVVASGNFPGGE